MKKLILIGSGGHCKSCIDVIEAAGNWEISGILSSPAEADKTLLGYPIIGTDELIPALIAEDYSFLITIGQIKTAGLRKHLFNQVQKAGGELVTIISPKASVSRYATIGRGTIVMHGAFVNAGALIGSNCIVNTGANLDHDCHIDDHVHISTHAVVNGNCTIGSECFIGSNAVLGQGIQIAPQVIVGAGSVVIKNINKQGVYAGNPANELQTKA